ncbi:anti-repressor SinI family protein [Priestia aryabhattai]
MNNHSETIPKEWMDLAKEAMNSNVSKEDFKKFLEQKAKDSKDNKEE